MTSSILVNILIVSAVRAGYLSARKATDPYIVCPGSLPGADAGWPTNYSPNNYGSLTSLCSTANGNSGANVGCICTTSEGQLHCDPNVADSNLYNAPPLNTGQTFPEYCQGGCYCQSQTQSVQSIEFSRSNMASPFDTRGPLDTGNSGAAGSAQPSNTTDGGPYPVATVAANTYTNQCGTNCSSSADCTGGSDCTCQTQSQQIVPGAGPGVGTVQYFAACIILLSAAGPGKRDEAWPCPCNATYVSHACCEAQDGLVWESWDNKLGELAGAGEM